jgi:hypothetical protein
VIGVVSFGLRSSEGLNFAVPINYVRGLLNTAQGPMTLEQMRGSLSGSTSESNQTVSGPSLKETLEWLKATIPLATTQYATSSTFGPLDWSTKTLPLTFESCTIAFDVVYSTAVPKTRPELGPRATTFRWTVPLGAITGKVTKVDMKSLTDQTDEQWWVVRLEAASNVILREIQGPAWNSTTSEDTALLVFNDGSVAQRVLTAFLHAAELCRKEEPF